jgi:hypothetical protein
MSSDATKCLGERLLNATVHAREVHCLATTGLDLEKLTPPR